MNEKTLNYIEVVEHLEKLVLKVEGWKNRYILRQIINDYKNKIEYIR